ESGTFRCGQQSSNAPARPSLPRNKTIGVPNSVVASGARFSCFESAAMNQCPLMWTTDASLLFSDTRAAPLLTRRNEPQLGVPCLRLRLVAQHRACFVFDDHHAIALLAHERVEIAAGIHHACRFARRVHERAVAVLAAIRGDVELRAREGRLLSG